MSGLDDRERELAVVLGAGGGIGRELVRLLAHDGCRLVLADADARVLQEVAGAHAGAVVAHRRLDVTDDVAVREFAGATLAGFGAPALLLSCVGALGPLHRRTWECSDEDWNRTFAVNLMGPISCVRAFLPAMRDSGKPAHVVLLSSLGALYASPRLGPYASAKRALVSFAETLRLELAAEGSGVDVTIVCPGSAPTTLNRALREAHGDAPLLREWLDAREVAQRIHRQIPGRELYVFTHETSRDLVHGYLEGSCSS